MSGKKVSKAKSPQRSKRAANNARTATNEGGEKTKSTQRSSENGSIEDRSGRRVPIQLLVDYKSGGNYLFDFCRDLGTGGVFIETGKPLPTGSSIDLTFTIPDSKETVSAKGTVIWVQAPVDGRKDLTPGMGVQFQGFSTEQRRLLDEFVQRYHGQRLTDAVDKRAG